MANNPSTYVIGEESIRHKKGTLSSGVEIAVASVATSSAKDWTSNIETQFRKKINHENFFNLLGYCEEAEPFTRILVFEYASNGSVFEHLHYEEWEHLDWVMRLRIAMGIAYCLDHMHGLKPRIVHNNLFSSSVHLTEDYAVKVADFNFCYLKGPSETETSTNALIATHISVTTKEDNVNSFGLLLFELITGKLPDSVKLGDSVDFGMADFLRGKSLREMVDPTLECYDDKVENIGEVIKSCVKADSLLENCIVLLFHKKVVSIEKCERLGIRILSICGDSCFSIYCLWKPIHILLSTKRIRMSN